MDPVTLALIGASLGGGIMQAAGQRQPRSISVEWLKKNFGADAVNEELIRLFNQMINSPYGQQLIESASVQGQDIESDMARRAAAAGMGPAGGAESGASIFSQAAAGQAGQGLRRQARADVYKAALPVAANIVGSRMGAAVGSEQARMNAELTTPTVMQGIGEAVGRGAAAGLSVPTQARPGPQFPTTVNPITGAPAGTAEEGFFNMASQFVPQQRRPNIFSRMTARFLGRPSRLVTTGVER